MTSQKFTVNIELSPNSPIPYQLKVEFRGEKDFYDRLVKNAEQEGMLFTRRKLVFPMTLLHQNKYIYQIDRPTSRKTKHQQWKFSDLILNKTDTIVIESKNDASEIQKSLDFFLQFYLQEQEKKYRTKLL